MALEMPKNLASSSTPGVEKFHHVMETEWNKNNCTLRVDALVQNQLIVPEKVEKRLEILWTSVDEEGSGGINSTA